MQLLYNNTCISHQRNLIYSLHCNICLKTCNYNINNDIKQGEYIGETSRHLIKRLNEHINVIQKNKFNSSAMAAYYSNFQVLYIPTLNKNTGLYLTT